MPRPSEIRHFADRLASLTVAAARADDSETLDDVQRDLEETFLDAFWLILNDALPDRPTILPAELLLSEPDGDGRHA